jgi:hypothetical protein
MYISFFVVVIFVERIAAILSAYAEMQHFELHGVGSGRGKIFALFELRLEAVEVSFWEKDEETG